jgi:hypothetical protein
MLLLLALLEWSDDSAVSHAIQWESNIPLFTNCLIYAFKMIPLFTNCLIYAFKMKLKY